MIGTTIGNYRIVEKLGAGGMGEVYRAIDTILEREVALKSLHPFLTQDAGRLERFHSEAKTLAKLNHPNIAILHTFFAHNDVHYMVMEYVEGETFESLIRRFGRVPLRNTLEMFIAALKGLEHAHARKVIHRDIKPANLMLNSEGVVKITDFGIARVVGGQRLTQTGKLIGTLEYMSPEQVRGHEQDARSDVYSLGILLYEMVAGQVPFSSESDYEIMRSHLEAAPRSLRDFGSDVPAEIENIVVKALAKDPAHRFADAREFRLALEPILATLPAAGASQIVPQIHATREASLADLAAIAAPVAAVTSAVAAPPVPPTNFATPAPTRTAAPAPKSRTTQSWMQPRFAMAGAVALFLVIGLSAAAMRFRPATDIPKVENQSTPAVDPDANSGVDIGATNSASGDNKSANNDVPPPLPPIDYVEPDSPIIPLPTPKSLPKAVTRPATSQPKATPKPAARKVRARRESSQPVRVRRKVRAIRRSPVVRRRVAVRRSTPVRRSRPRASGSGGEAALRAAIKGN